MDDPFRIFPKPTRIQREELRDSIAAVGLSQPVCLDEHKNLIDGHSRRDVCRELNLDYLAGADVRIGLTDLQKKSLAIEMNLWRRPINLTRAKRNELIEVYLLANPDLADDKIAGLFSVDRTTVNRKRTRLVQMHKLPKIEATVGKDGVRRRVGNRARWICKSAKEYDSIIPDIREVSGDVHGLIRRPGKFVSIARRLRKLAEVKEAKIPSTHRITCGDFRDLKVKKGSVDLLLTDVEWSLDSARDWNDLGRLAAQWLKPSGLFVSYIGVKSYPYFCNELMQNLIYQWTINLRFNFTCRMWSSRILERWRPIVIFGKRPDLDINMMDTMEGSGQEKDYDAWQQGIPEALHLMEHLSKKGSVILDTQCGTGTNGVAVSLLGHRTFLGNDINPEMVKITRHRIATEGKQKSA